VNRKTNVIAITVIKLGSSKLTLFTPINEFTKNINAHKIVKNIYLNAIDNSV
jgi:hypothetical protein